MKKIITDIGLNQIGTENFPETITGIIRKEFPLKPEIIERLYIFHETGEAVSVKKDSTRENIRIFLLRGYISEHQVSISEDKLCLSITVKYHEGEKEVFIFEAEYYSNPIVFSKNIPMEIILAGGTLIINEILPNSKED